MAGFYADHGRVLKTTDGGLSWNQIYNEESANAVRSVALNPLSPNQLVIGTASGSVIKSADGGMTWQSVKDFGDQVNRVLWQNGNVYVLLKTKGLFKSAGLSGDFVELTANLSTTYKLAGLSYTSNTVDSFSQVYVDFLSPDLIYLTSSRGVFKTVDEGSNWTVLSSLPIKPGSGTARAVAVGQASSNIVFVSVGSTIYKSTDGGGTWQTQGLITAGFVNYVLIDPQLPQIVYAGVYSTQ